MAGGADRSSRYWDRSTFIIAGCELLAVRVAGSGKVMACQCRAKLKFGFGHVEQLCLALKRFRCSPLLLGRGHTLLVVASLFAVVVFCGPI